MTEDDDTPALYRWALNQSIGNCIAKHILLCLAFDACERGGEAAISQVRLAAMTELSIRSVQRALSRLQTMGHIKQIGRGIHIQGVSSYKLMVDRPCVAVDELRSA